MVVEEANVDAHVRYKETMTVSAPRGRLLVKTGILHTGAARSLQKGQNHPLTYALLTYCPLCAMDISPADVLYAYQHGVFPMADPDADDALVWVRPDPRGILPLKEFHVPTNLQKLVDQGAFTVRTDAAFDEVMAACADRSSTWLSDELQALFRALHRQGYAHSVEAYYEGALAGGLYGLALGGAFFGESMFYREDNASKVALVHLVEQLKAGGFILLDIQWATDHLRQFGAMEIPRPDYERRLQAALLIEATWWPQRNGLPS